MTYTNRQSLFDRSLVLVDEQTMDELLEIVNEYYFNKNKEEERSKTICFVHKKRNVFYGGHNVNVSGIYCPDNSKLTHAEDYTILETVHLGVDETSSI